MGGRAYPGAQPVDHKEHDHKEQVANYVQKYAKPKMTQNFEPIENLFIFEKNNFLDIGAFGIVPESNHKEWGPNLIPLTPPFDPLKLVGH